MKRLQSDLIGISAFVQTVDAGSFTAAADRVGLSKSAVGKSVARLEAQLGVRLLERTTRTLSLTTEGQSYYQLCTRILAELEEAETHLASTRHEVSGRLRVSLPVSFGPRWVMPILVALAGEHPKLSLDVSFTDRRVDLVDEGYDLVVRLGDPGDQASLLGRRLGALRPLLCAAPAYIAAHGRPRTVSDLARHQCIGYARHSRPVPWVLPDGAGRLTPAPVEWRHMVGHGEALREAVVAGLGVGYLSTWLAADDIRAGRLVAILNDTPFETGPITALWPKSRQLSPKVRTAIDALAQAFVPTPPWDQGGGGPESGTATLGRESRGRRAPSG